MRNKELTNENTETHDHQAIPPSFTNQGLHVKYPNTRYGNPQEFRYYAQGLPIKALAKQLQRSEKSISAWLNGDRKIPFWVPELMRLRHMERRLRFQQMGIMNYRTKFGLVKDNVLTFK
jgi:hypothetical protein